MMTETLNITGTAMQKMPRASEQIDTGRKSVQEDASKDQAGVDKKKVQPEEILTQIKALTENGQFSVRFENDARSKVMVVKIVDSETQEVIRQVPAEELLGMRAALDNLHGNLIDTKS
jgi:flagellar protein FlaG